ncbi:ferredoxin [Blastococcus capsensis]|uniref:ferredoxin n=1 Tax=Blastococcus capsensis TaxID=1564163 RepID=UPI00254001A3|nr:ferredoxin [Blastococcus capsensis]MDK3258791.1 ferredoxin [Blastococcus capsensis]
MTRLEADFERCVGAGACEAVAPDVFEVGDDGTVRLLRPHPADADLPDVREAVRACPTRALRLVTEQPAPGGG